MIIKSRRSFISLLLGVISTSVFSRMRNIKMINNKIINNTNESTTVNVVKNGSPNSNVRKIIELAGGIETLIGQDDIVIIKPNLQWWNQGAPNIAACNALIEMIMDRSGGFNGEVILGENTHRGKKPWEKTGWAVRFERNVDIPNVNNYNELCALLKKQYGDRFSVSHWIDVSSGGKRVLGPQDGPGYIYCDGTGGVPLVKMDNGLSGNDHREVIMSYPVLKTDRGTIVDFKNGEWHNGAYTERPIKFINLAALNHHSAYSGMTSSIKNYFGITDISHGADPVKGGKLSGNYFNFHAFAFNEWADGPVAGMMGSEIGLFMQKIRKADLNIITAEWVGLASRTDCPVSKTQAVVASTDPVALDYYAAKYILYQNSHCRHHDPDWQNGPLYQYLRKCAEITGYIINEQQIIVKSYDFLLKDLKTGWGDPVFGSIQWGKDIKTLIKYFLFRFGNIML